jgi:hypothetical protein
MDEAHIILKDTKEGKNANDVSKLVEKLTNLKWCSDALSGAFACRWILLTATPIVDHPVDLINLAMLLSTKEECTSHHFNTFTDINYDEKRPGNKARTGDRFMSVFGDVGGAFPPDTVRKFKDLFHAKFSVFDLTGDVSRFADPEIEMLDLKLTNYQTKLILGGNCTPDGDAHVADEELGGTLENLSNKGMIFENGKLTRKKNKNKTEKYKDKKQCIQRSVIWPPDLTLKDVVDLNVPENIIKELLRLDKLPFILKDKNPYLHGVINKIKNAKVKHVYVNYPHGLEVLEKLLTLNGFERVYKETKGDKKMIVVNHRMSQSEKDFLIDLFKQQKLLLLTSVDIKGLEPNLVVADTKVKEWPMNLKKEIGNFALPGNMKISDAHIGDIEVLKLISPVLEALVGKVKEKKTQSAEILDTHYRKNDAKVPAYKRMQYMKQYIYVDVPDSSNQDTYGSELIEKVLSLHCGYVRLNFPKLNKSIVREQTNFDRQKYLRTEIGGAPIPPYKGMIILDGALHRDAWAIQKKQCLDFFNSEQNKDGRDCMLLVNTRRFKEGIDLKAIHAVHMVGYFTSVADKTQALRRAIRNCSHKLLPYKPHVGWKLDVTMYSPTFQGTELTAMDLHAMTTSNIQKATKQMKEILKEVAFDRLLLKTINDASGKDVFAVKPVKKDTAVKDITTRFLNLLIG